MNFTKINLNLVLALLCSNKSSKSTSSFQSINHFSTNVKMFNVSKKKNNHTFNISLK